jgi:haloacetate dehalogenase
MIAADPDLFFGHFLDAWTEVDAAIPLDVRAAHLHAARPVDAVRAMCADHRAEAFLDADLDRRDHAAGQRLTIPVAALWQDPGEAQLPCDPAAVWRSWATQVRSRPLPCGHFLPEERPDDVTRAVHDLMCPSST